MGARTRRRRSPAAGRATARSPARSDEPRTGAQGTGSASPPIDVKNKAESTTTAIPASHPKTSSALVFLSVLSIARRIRSNSHAVSAPNATNKRGEHRDVHRCRAEALEVEVRRLDEDEADGEQKDQPERDALPGAEPSQPGLSGREERGAQDPRRDARKERERHRPAERDLAYLTSVRRVGADQLRPRQESGDTHSDAPQHTSHEYARDDPCKRRTAHVAPERSE